LLEATQGMCFACGPANPIGLKLEFREEGDTYRCDFVPRPEFQGYDEIVHGGIVATILDEAMARWLWQRELKFATAELTVRYVRPLKVGAPATATARMEKESSRMIEMSAQIEDGDGNVVAKATARFLPVRDT
jgi:uncharacterized protein (TIGR00369 family)